MTVKNLSPDALTLWRMVEADAHSLFTGAFHLGELVDFIQSLTQLAQKMLQISGVEKRQVVTEIILYVVKKYGLVSTITALIPLPFWLKPFASPILNAVIPLIVSIIVSIWKT